MDDPEAVGTVQQPDLGSAFTNSPMGVALARTDGEFIVANRALAELLGRSAEELVGTRLFDVTHPEEVTGALALCAGLQRSRDRERYECRFLRPDGTQVPVQVTTSWVEGSLDSGPPHLVMVVEDVTDR